tara:strand:+ start:5438 stop:6139 length:702 start_codon:yes stop_codon:yes gene_type:complete
MNFDKAYVIGSKEISKKRLDNFFKRNKLKNKNIELWPAINGKQVNIKKYQNLNYLTDNFKLNMPGSLGCLLSHITLWEKCEKDKDCQIALIFEDDTEIKQNFDDLLNEIDLTILPKDWTMLKLSYKGLIGKSISNTIVKPESVKKKGANAGNWCYLLNTKNVQKLLNIILPYDNQISLDVILRGNIEELNIFFSKNNLAKHYENKYSPRKDLNKPKKTLFELIKINLRKYFYH